MSAERLSRLQKWILIQALENWNYGICSNKDIMTIYWGKENVYPVIETWHDRIENQCLRNKYRATVSRSIKNLEEKGLIEALYGQRDKLELSKKGYVLALKLTAIHAINDKKNPLPQKMR